MYLLGILVVIGTGIYTVSWAWTLLKGGNRAGAFWSFLLAVASTATALYFFYQNGFFP
jgi:phosphoglycerol transferase MdoB-like AlkP superfamily enzyme